MLKIKCCNVTCKFNDCILIKNKDGSYDGYDTGYCTSNNEVELTGYECKNCGDDSEGISCKTFEWKDMFLHNRKID